ncbi:hypothetical protein Tcan_09910, partial [Toxocara canis]
LQPTSEEGLIQAEGSGCIPYEEQENCQISDPDPAEGVAQQKFAIFKKRAQQSMLAKFICYYQHETFAIS